MVDIQPVEGVGLEEAAHLLVAQLVGVELRSVFRAGECHPQFAPAVPFDVDDRVAAGGVGECAGDGDGHGLACRNVHCRRHCCHGLSVYGIGDIGQRKSADVIGDRNTCGIPDAGVVDGDGVSHGLSGNAGVVLLSQIAALIADQTVLGGGDDCLVLFHGDGILGIGLAVRHLVGQCGVVVRIHGADNLCCHGLAAGNIPESHRVAGNRAAVFRGDVYCGNGGCHDHWKGR